MKVGSGVVGAPQTGAILINLKMVQTSEVFKSRSYVPF
jgi:hypothetical protein